MYSAGIRRRGRAAERHAAGLSLRRRCTVMSRRVVEFPDVEAVGQTEKALLVRFDEDDEEWVPQSQIHEDSEVWNKGDVGLLVVTEWWSQKAGREP